MAHKITDLDLPISVVSRLVKDALPEGTVISQEALLGFNKAAAVFIIYLTSSAATSKFSRDKIKTLSSDDVMKILTADSEWDAIVNEGKIFLDDYRKKKVAKETKRKLVSKSEEENNPCLKGSLNQLFSGISPDVKKDAAVEETSALILDEGKS